MTSPSPESVVQRQLDAYNAHDLDALLATYAEDAEQLEHPSTRLALGHAEIRARFATRFAESDPHAVLVNRIVSGHRVVDHERITRTFPEGRGTIELIAIYEVLEGRIRRAWFAFGPRVDA